MMSNCVREGDSILIDCGAFDGGTELRNKVRYRQFEFVRSVYVSEYLVNRRCKIHHIRTAILQGSVRLICTAPSTTTKNL